MAADRQDKQDVRQASRFIGAIQYVGGVMSVVLVEDYDWTVDEVEKLVEKMRLRGRWIAGISGGNGGIRGPGGGYLCGNVSGTDILDGPPARA